MEAYQVRSVSVLRSSGNFVVRIWIAEELDCGKGSAFFAGAGCYGKLSLPFDGSRLDALTRSLEEEGHRTRGARIPSDSPVRQQVEAK